MAPPEVIDWSGPARTRGTRAFRIHRTSVCISDRLNSRNHPGKQFCHRRTTYLT